MKTTILLFTSITMGFAQPSPPVLSPSSVFIPYGTSTTLSASGCAGTVNWSTGQNGNTISVSPKQSGSFSATCTFNSQTSGASNAVLVQVGLANSPCGNALVLNQMLSNTGASFESADLLSSTDKINNNASILYKAENAMSLNPGFEAKTGSVFKAKPGKCGELQTREVLATNLSLPWEILWGPDDYLWVTEKAGTISRVNPADGNKIPLITIADVTVYGEGGLLGMVLHPDFTNNPYVYVVYNYGPPPTGVKEKVVRYTYSGGVLASSLILFDNIAGWVNHNGSRLLISPDLKLFITTGDAANLSNPQNDASVNGKVLRINLDGTIPTDNPVAGSAVWSKGHRNSQGMVLANGKLYVSSHGDNTEDEINLVVQSGNYGYPNVAGPCNTSAEIAFCNSTPTISPIFSSGGVTWAFCGLDYYNNDTYPRWKNHLLMVSLKNQTFYTFKLSPDGNTIIGPPTEYYAYQYGRLRDIAISPSGKVYICTNNINPSDKIIEISPVVD
jgi:aldose sugar dehydrogenase